MARSPVGYRTLCHFGGTIQMMLRCSFYMGYLTVPHNLFTSGAMRRRP